MFVYGGIDEAGYGPMFGPLLVGRCVLAVPNLPADAPCPQLWQRLAKVVCKTRSSGGGGGGRSGGGGKGRIAVNDSKKLYSPDTGLHHLERGVLAFAALAGHRPQTVHAWLDCLGESAHHDLAALPWYQPDDQRPWALLPRACTGGEISVAAAMLKAAAGRIGVQALDVGAAVVFEDRFNTMVAATRSKAATSFTFVAAHLRHIWDHYGEHQPTVVVDRQSGRTHYRELLAQAFPEAAIRVLDETEICSAYKLDAPGHVSRGLSVSFLVEAEQRHMPVALASMISKYTRELLMERFQNWFLHHCPAVKPTAGYATDAQRFWRDIEPLLPALAIDPQRLRRMA